MKFMEKIFDKNTSFSNDASIQVILILLQGTTK